jgi:hypothetical protein
VSLCAVERQKLALRGFGPQARCGAAWSAAAPSQLALRLMMLRCRALHAQLRGATRGAGASRLAGERCCGALPVGARSLLPARALAPHVCGGKHVKKGDLPSKVCVQCNRPFNWCVRLLLT